MSKITFENGPLAGACLELNETVGKQVFVSECDGSACRQKHFYEKSEGTTNIFKFLRSEKFDRIGHVVGGFSTDQLIWD